MQGSTHSLSEYNNVLVGDKDTGFQLFPEQWHPASSGAKRLTGVGDRVNPEFLLDELLIRL